MKRDDEHETLCASSPTEVGLEDSKTASEHLAAPVGPLTRQALLDNDFFGATSTSLWTYVGESTQEGQFGAEFVGAAATDSRQTKLRSTEREQDKAFMDTPTFQHAAKKIRKLNDHPSVHLQVRQSFTQHVLSEVSTPAVPKAPLLLDQTCLFEGKTLVFCFLYPGHAYNRLLYQPHGSAKVKDFSRKGASDRK